jgi:hypothetical protein
MLILCQYHIFESYKINIYSAWKQIISAYQFLIFAHIGLVLHCQVLWFSN